MWYTQPAFVIIVRLLVDDICKGLKCCQKLCSFEKGFTIPLIRSLFVRSSFSGFAESLLPDFFKIKHLNTYAEESDLALILADMDLSLTVLRSF